MNQRVLHFACTVIFSLSLASIKNLGDVFAKKSYEKWKKALERFDKHAASHPHNNAIMKCDDFMDQRKSVTNKVVKYTKEEEARYKICLTSSLEIVRFLIEQGGDFRGHD